MFTKTVQIQIEASVFTPRMQLPGGFVLRITDSVVFLLLLETCFLPSMDTLTPESLWAFGPDWGLSHWIDRWDTSPPGQRRVWTPPPQPLHLSIVCVTKNIPIIMRTQGCVRNCVCVNMWGLYCRCEDRRWSFVTYSSGRLSLYKWWLPVVRHLSEAFGCLMKRRAEAWMASGACLCVWELCVLLDLVRLRT